MRIRIICVGKLKERFYSDAVSEFRKRLSRFAELEVVEVADEKVCNDPSSQDIERVKAIECGRLLERLVAGEYVIALDILGKPLSSEQLSAMLSSCMNMGKSRFAFLIGGSHGLTDSVRTKADFVLSFSKMTFSHQIFRIMLLEQLYRSLKIINGEPYHK